jgi:two-component system, OmpR family, phosphate regulon response regulator PhoB
MAHRVAVVEDEGDILDSICLALVREGHNVVGLADGTSALLEFRQRVPDLVVVDWMLPGLSGIDLCRTLRADARFARTAVCMLTARATEMDVVAGLSAGADDYVIKPFRTRELMARIRTLLRRTEALSDGAALRRFGDLWLDGVSHRAGNAGGTFDLTPTEFRLLDLLLQYPCRVFSRSQVIACLWPDDRAVDDRVVDVHIARLREKLGAAGGMVETVRGAGYRLAGG